LGEGVRLASEKIGRGVEMFAMHVKELEIPLHSPYRFKEMGLAYAVSNREACHNRGSPAYVSRGALSPEIGLDIKTDGFVTEAKGMMTKIRARTMQKDFTAMTICHNDGSNSRVTLLIHSY
jgi:aldehyde:ferredoxin oxidoreductase